MLVQPSSSRQKHEVTMSTTATETGPVQLCASCQNFKWPQPPIADNQIYDVDPPHKTFLALEESAVAGCNLCQLFWGCIINTENCANKLATRFLSEASFSLEIGNFEGGIDLNLYARGTSDYVYGFIELARLKANGRKQSEVLEKRQVERFFPGTMCDDLRKLVDKRILPWMKDCYEHRENHSWCGLSGDATIYPTRLIDIGEAEDDSIRLIETDHKSVTNPYLILSYCWGQGNESAKTTRHNLESRLCGFSTTTLPKTIRDSVVLTRMMGFRYLWVDAICIVQATEDDVGDFKLEAVRMRDYYANAQCCISASLARDSSEGFLTERPLAKCPVPRIVLEFGFSTTSQSVLVELKERDADLRRVLLTSPLMERGWYMQELMLSRRILHWTLNGIYLECQSSKFIEGRVQSLDRIPTYPEPRDALAVADDEVLGYAGWYQLIESYSSKQLTYESDRMYAIHGITSLYVHRYGAEYSHGVFRSSIAQGLAWYHQNDDLMGDNHDLRRKPPRHVEASFPTWSWASNCSVYFCELEVGFVRDDHPQRPPLFPVHPGNMSLTEAIDSRLYIRAPLIVVFLQRVNNRITASIKDSLGEWINGRVLGSLDAQRSNQHDTLYESFLAGLDEGFSVSWLVLGSDADGEDWYVGLLLKRGENTLYQRYGLLQIRWQSDNIWDLFNTVEEIILE